MIESTTTLASSRRRGSILMEVVIALSLFFVAGVFIMDGLNSSIRGVSTIKLEADATDLAVTTFSEVQMGLTPLENAGPVGVAFAGAEGWTYELIVEPVEELTDMPQLKRVHVVVRNDANAFTYRTTHLVWDNPNPPQQMEEQLQSGLAGDILGGAGAAAGGGAPTLPGGATGGGNPGTRPSAANATPQFPPRGGNAKGNDATPRFPPSEGNTKGSDATPRIPPRGGNGKTPDATPRFPRNDGKQPAPTPPKQNELPPQPELDEDGNPISRSGSSAKGGAP